MALCVALFSEELITVLTPVSYHGAIPIITILSMYMGFLFFGKITGTQLIYSKKTFISSFLTGNLNAKVLVIEEGAQFEGVVNMIKKAEPVKAE